MQAASLKASRGAAPAAAGGAPADERGARGEGACCSRSRTCASRSRTARSRRRARRLEEKAEQLALSSKYKSEFLANMSHELRTPLNSLLILARLFAENPEQNLTDKQTRVREHDLHRGQRPARPDQRHPRPLEGRGREDGRPGHRPRLGGRARLRRPHLPPGRRAEGARVPGRGRRTSSHVGRSRPTSSACSRCSRTSSRTRASSRTSGTVTLRIALAPRRHALPDRGAARGGRPSSPSPSRTPASASPRTSSS